MAPFVCGEGGSLAALQRVLWHERLTVLLQLIHWKLRASDAWTVPLSEAAASELARTLDRLAVAPPEIQL